MKLSAPWNLTISTNSVCEVSIRCVTVAQREVNRAWGLSVSAQEEFDNKYISSTEVCQQLGIHRTTVLLALKSGRLPVPIMLRRPNGQPQILLWERAPLLPILAEWKQARAGRAVA